MELTAGQVEKVFGRVPILESGLGILETGSIAGGLSSLFSIGFTLLGYASSQMPSDDMVVKCSGLSRAFGACAQRLGEFIPAIPDVDRSEVLGFGGRLKKFTVEGLYGELGPTGAVAFSVGYLGSFLERAIGHFLGRCSDLSDKSFSRALYAAQSVIVEARTTIEPDGIKGGFTPGERLMNVRVIEEILDLLWLQ